MVRTTFHCLGSVLLSTALMLNRKSFAHPNSNLCHAVSTIIQSIAPALLLLLASPLLKFVFQPQLGSLHPQPIFICSYSFSVHLSSTNQMPYTMLTYTNYACFNNREVCFQSQTREKRRIRQ